MWTLVRPAATSGGIRRERMLGLSTENEVVIYVV
jgi:hypothetical protein